jgi:uncharacterized protein (DUF433 family)
VFKRINANSTTLGGKPFVKGTRISVELLLDMLAAGASRDQILRMYPQLSELDIEEAVLYARQVLHRAINASAKEDLLREIDLGLKDLKEGRVSDWNVDEFKQEIRQRSKGKKAS